MYFWKNYRSPTYPNENYFVKYWVPMETKDKIIITKQMD